ncbi:hypothetical protein SAMN05216197_108166 [Pseudomonas graminis]|uniref:Uncharacterized protein n=1 Tax=Pseudomonas graminis TaxID=158627 RepID=A0A1I0CS48_9PSED|nr:hypothetical protein SAMN05216197_108166 [Pseudomonas graminis]
MKFAKKLQECDIAPTQARNGGPEPCTGIAVAIAIIVR